MPLAFLPLAFALLAAPPAADPTIPTGVHATLMVQGQGYQMYSCTQQNGAWRWTLVAPAAKLLDMETLAEVGKHTGGPTWTWQDGSSVTGKPIQTYTPDPNSIPWLLLEAAPGPKAGSLGHITRIRRSNTQGGLAPTTGCDATHANASNPVPYTATYTFYEAQ